MLARRRGYDEFCFSINSIAYTSKNIRFLSEKMYSFFITMRNDYISGVCDYSDYKKLLDGLKPIVEGTDCIQLEEEKLEDLKKEYYKFFPLSESIP